MSLFRGAEYARLTQDSGKEPLTFYDMNLSAQDHQTFFACDVDEGKADYDIMQRAWRERNQSSRIALANEALAKNPEYAPNDRSMERVQLSGLTALLSGARQP